MNAVIQAAGYDHGRAPLAVAGGAQTLADAFSQPAPLCRMYNLNGGLQAWVQQGGAPYEALQRQIKTAAEDFVLVVYNDGGEDNPRLLRLLFCQAGAAKLPAAGSSIVIFVTRHWLDVFFNSGLKTAALQQQLQALPGMAYRQPLPASWEYLALQILETGGNLLFTMNRLLLLFEKFVNRLALLLNDPAGISVFPECELGRLQQTELELRNALCGPAPTIAMLARKAAMSPTKLKKIFRDVYGAPIYQYYQKMRMRHARLLLEGGEYSVKEAGLKVGYTNLSHFSSAFKKEFGLLPSQFVSGRRIQEFAYKVLE